MRRLMVFNPEHDLALSNGDKHFIAPANIRQMAHDLAPLLELIDCDHPVVWGWDSAVKSQLLRMGIAEAELPSDSALKVLRTYSERQTAHHLLRAFRAEHPDAPYIGESILAHHPDDIVAYTEQHGHILLKDPLSSSGKGLRHVNKGGLPLSPSRGGGTPDNSKTIPQEPLQGSLEHSKKHCPSKVGGRAERNEMEQSGGGMSSSSLAKVESWATALIRRHGYLTAEPYYNKVQDFAMEFYIRDRQCHFIGYSLFTTNRHGRYEGNILMTDEKIEAHLSQYVPQASLHEVRDWVISHYEHIIPAEWDTTRFPLHFGIDMMVIKTTDNRLRTTDYGQFRIQNCLWPLRAVNSVSGFKLHPCVEINLRMNMGIIAHEVRRTLLAPGAEGTFHVTTFPTEEAAQRFYQEHIEQFPPLFQAEKIVSGYYPLTPIHFHTRHHAYIVCRKI